MNPGETIFQSERIKYTKAFYIIWLIFLLALNIWGVVTNPDDSYADNLIGGIGSLVLIWIVIYFYKNNYYKLSDKKLEIVSRFREWNIKIEDIYLIKLNQNQAALNSFNGKQARAGQALRGIIIHYNKNCSIYICPSPREKFIEMICDLNKDIEVRPGPPQSN